MNLQAATTKSKQQPSKIKYWFSERTWHLLKQKALALKLGMTEKVKEIGITLRR